MSFFDDAPELLTALIFFGVIIVPFGIYFYIAERKSKSYQQSVTEALQPLFPGVTVDEHNICFQCPGFKVKIEFYWPAKNSSGRMEFHFQRADASVIDLDRADRNRIFEIRIPRKELLDPEYKNLDELKKDLKIRADDPVLKQNLANEDALLNNLWDIYAAAKSRETSLRLHQNGARIYCWAFVEDADSVKNVIQAAIKACNLAISAASKVGIDYTAPMYDDIESDSLLDESPNSSAASDSANEANELDGSVSGTLAVNESEKALPPSHADSQRERERQESESHLFF